jgi:hypothetical protein
MTTSDFLHRPQRFCSLILTLRGRKVIHTVTVIPENQANIEAECA